MCCARCAPSTAFRSRRCTRRLLMRRRRSASTGFCSGPSCVPMPAGLFLDRYGELVELTASGQLAMRLLFEEHLKRIEWDTSRFPVRLYPFLSASAPTDERPIVINRSIAFGRPVVLRKGISTSAIAERVDAGESVDD